MICRVLEVIFTSISKSSELFDRLHDEALMVLKNDISRDENLGALFGEIVGGWQSESKDNSLKLLSALTGISYSHIRVLAKGEATPTLDSFYKLTMGIWPAERARNFFKERLGVDKGALLVANEKSTVSSGLLTSTMDCLFIVKIASLEKLSVEHAQTMLGTAYESVLKKFIEAEFVHFQGDSIVLNTQSNEILSGESLKTLARFILEVSDPTMPKHFTETRAVGLNEKGLEEVTELVRDFKSRLYSIISDESKTGDVTFCLTLNSATV